MNSSTSDDNDPLQVLSRGALSSPDISYFRVDITEKEDTILSGIVRVVTVPEGESCRPWSVNDEIVSLSATCFSRNARTHLLLCNNRAFARFRQYSTEPKHQLFLPPGLALPFVQCLPALETIALDLHLVGAGLQFDDELLKLVMLHPSRFDPINADSELERLQGHHRTTSAASLSHRKQGIYGVRFAGNY